ncbi:MAG TPA: lipid II flippase MurJ, partial [Rhodospirillales bacterium]
TPVKISVVCLIVNLVLNLILMVPLKHVGIATATAVASWLNAGLLAYVLGRRGHLVVDARLARRVPRVVVAAAGMALTLFAALTPLQASLAGSLSERIAALAVLVLGGMAVFGALAAALGAARLSDLKSLTRSGGAS